MCSGWATSKVAAHIIGYYVLRTLCSCFFQGLVEVDPKRVKGSTIWGKESQSNGEWCLIQFGLLLTEVP